MNAFVRFRCLLLARALRRPRPALSESILYVDASGRCCGLVYTAGCAGPYAIREITGASAAQALTTAHF